MKILSKTNKNQKKIKKILRESNKSKVFLRFQEGLVLSFSKVSMLHLHSTQLHFNNRVQAKIDRKANIDRPL